MPAPASPAPAARGNGVSLIGWAAAVSLAFNVFLGVWLWRVNHRQNARLARLEAFAKASRPQGAGDTPPASESRASREDRVAFLLAVAGNADESRKVLEDVSIPECVEMVRALLARPAASDRNAAVGALFQRIAGTEPARAVALLDQAQEPTLRSTLAVRVANLWIEQSPDDAARWLAANGENFLARDAFDAQLGRAAARWSAYDPASATPFLAARANLGPAALAALANSSTEWGRKDPATALTFAFNLTTTDPRRFGVVQGILAGWAEREPARAAAYLQQRLYDGGEGGELYFSTVGLIADRWAGSDLNAAAQWAATLPSRRARRDAMRRVTAAWVAIDLPGAARWAGTLPADPSRAAVWQTVVNSWPGGDIDGEGTWVSGLPAGPERAPPGARPAGSRRPATSRRPGSDRAAAPR